MWFSALSEFSQGIPGLKTFSKPFQDAAEAARKQVLENAKAVNLKERIGQLTNTELTTGKGLTADRIKQLGLEDIVGKKRGTSAAQALRAAKDTAKTQGVGLTGLQAGFKSLGPIITKAMGPLAIIKVVADIAKFFVDAMFDASKLVAELQRDMALTAEEAEVEYARSEKGLRFQLIEGRALAQSNIQINFEDLKAFTSNAIRQQMAQFGQTNPTDEEVQGIVARVLSNQEEVKRLSDQVVAAKLLEVFKEKANPTTKEVTYEEFIAASYGE
jgi:hypothetical protein